VVQGSSAPLMENHDESEFGVWDYLEISFAPMGSIPALTAVTGPTTPAIHADPP